MKTKSTDPPAVRYCQASSADAVSITDTPSSRSASAIAKRLRAFVFYHKYPGEPPVSVQSRPVIVAFVRALARPPQNVSQGKRFRLQNGTGRFSGQGKVVASFSAPHPLPTCALLGGSTPPSPCDSYKLRPVWSRICLLGSFLNAFMVMITVKGVNNVMAMQVANQIVFLGHTNRRQGRWQSSPLLYRREKPLRLE